MPHIWPDTPMMRRAVAGTLLAAGVGLAAPAAAQTGDSLAPLGLPPLGSPDGAAGPEASTPPAAADQPAAAPEATVITPSGPMSDAEAAQLMMRMQEQLMFLQLELKGEQLRNEIQKMRNDRLQELLAPQRSLPALPGQ